MIAVVGTGGTIASAADVEGGRATARLGAADLLERAGVRAEGHRIVDFSSKMSSALTIPDVVELARCIEREIAAGAEAVVVTHGTATLPETGYLLDLLLGDVPPVVCTGAMLPASELGADGPANLRDALVFAAASRGRRRGVHVVAGGEVHSPVRVLKLDGASPAGFVSYGRGPLGRIDAGEVVMHCERRVRSERFARLEPRVELVTATVGASTILLDAVRAAGVPGLVVAAFPGRGTVPPQWVRSIADYIADGGTAVLAAQSPVGRVVPRHGKEGSARDLSEHGMIAAGDLAPSKARCLLMALRGRTSDRDEIAAAVSLEWKCH